MVSARLRAMERRLVLERAEVCLEGMVNNLVIQWNIAMQMDWPLTELGLTIYCLGVTVRGNSRTATPRPPYRLSVERVHAFVEDFYQSGTNPGYQGVVNSPAAKWQASFLVISRLTRHALITCKGAVGESYRETFGLFSNRLG